MNLNNDSPLWPILKILVVGAVAAIMLEVMYANGFSPKEDIPTILAIVAALGGITGLQKFVNKNGGKE